LYGTWNISQTFMSAFIQRAAQRECWGAL